MIEIESILELVGHRRRRWRNDNSARLSDSKIIMTIQKKCSTHCLKGPELLKTGMLFSGKVLGKDMLYCVG